MPLKGLGVIIAAVVVLLFGTIAIITNQPSTPAPVPTECETYKGVVWCWVDPKYIEQREHHDGWRSPRYCASGETKACWPAPTPAPEARET